jgi:hypothetical protein
MHVKRHNDRGAGTVGTQTMCHHRVQTAWLQCAPRPSGRLAEHSYCMSQHTYAFSGLMDATELPFARQVLTQQPHSACLASARSLSLQIPHSLIYSQTNAQQHAMAAPEPY